MLRIDANIKNEYGWLCKLPTAATAQMNELKKKIDEVIKPLSIPEGTVPLMALDLETTDLNPFKGQILEMFFVLGYFDKEVKSFQRVIEFSVVYQYRVDMSANPLIKEVFDLHSRNGLFTEAAWSEVKNTQQFLTNVASIVEYFGQSINPKSPKPYLLGSGIHFDRSWLSIQSDILLKMCHYRMFDTTTLLIASQMLGFNVPKVPHEKVMNMVYDKDKVNVAHRAEYDVNKSLVLFNNYMATLIDAGIDFTKGLAGDPNDPDDTNKNITPALPNVPNTNQDEEVTSVEQLGDLELSIFATHPDLFEESKGDPDANNC